MYSNRFIGNKWSIRAIMSKALFNVSYREGHVFQKVLEFLKIANLFFSITLNCTYSKFMLSNRSINISTLCLLVNALVQGPYVDFLSHCVNFSFNQRALVVDLIAEILNLCFDELIEVFTRLCFIFKNLFHQLCLRQSVQLAAFSYRFLN